MEVVAATAAQFDTFLSDYGFTVPDADKARLLNLSLAFLNTVDICEAGDTFEAQCFIAYAMRDGGGFDITAVSDGRVLVTSELGRRAIVEEWEIDSELSGTDPLSLLKRIPMAYGLLKSMLCTSTGAVAAGSIGNIDVIR